MVTVTPSVILDISRSVLAHTSHCRNCQLIYSVESAGVRGLVGNICWLSSISYSLYAAFLSHMCAPTVLGLTLSSPYLVIKIVYPSLPLSLSLTTLSLIPLTSHLESILKHLTPWWAFTPMTGSNTFVHMLDLEILNLAIVMVVLVFIFQTTLYLLGITTEDHGGSHM